MSSTMMEHFQTLSCQWKGSAQRRGYKQARNAAGQKVILDEYVLPNGKWQFKFGTVMTALVTFIAVSARQLPHDQAAQFAGARGFARRLELVTIPLSDFD